MYWSKQILNSSKSWKKLHFKHQTRQTDHMHGWGGRKQGLKQLLSWALNPSDASAFQKSFAGIVKKDREVSEFPSLWNKTWGTQNFKISCKFETNSRHCSCLKNTHINKSTHVFLSNINKSNCTRNVGIFFTNYKLLKIEILVPSVHVLIWCVT